MRSEALLMAAVACGARHRERRHVVANDRERLVERFGAPVDEVLTDELKISFVKQRCLHVDGILPVDERADLDVDELDGMSGRRRGGGRDVKGHVSSPSCSAGTRDFRGRRTRRVLRKLYTCSGNAQSKRGFGGLKWRHGCRNESPWQIV